MSFSSGNWDTEFFQTKDDAFQEATDGKFQYILVQVKGKFWNEHCRLQQHQARHTKPKSLNDCVCHKPRVVFN